MTEIPRNPLVIGLGRSGLAAARLLRDLGAQVRVYDRREAVEDLPSGVTPYLGSPEPPADAFLGIDAMVLSPGVPPTSFLALCQRHAPNAAIQGELGLALSLLPQPGPVLSLVTGTNGKSTVTALLGELLRAGGRTPFVGGNLGDPVAECVRTSLCDGVPWPSDFVLECSSYQLETIPRVPTAVAILLNVTPDHIDRYASMSEYAATKARIFGGLGPGDLALLLDGDPWTEALLPSGPRTERVGRAGCASLGPNESLLVGDDPPIPRDALRLAGTHNAVNALFAIRAARHLGVSQAQCLAGLAAFDGLPHRMQRVRELRGVTYYNDSKATNAVSAIAGLQGLPAPFVLIAGGQSKGDDLGPLGDLLRQRARAVIGIGTSATTFAALASPDVPGHLAPDLPAAVRLAQELALPGDLVVLSPACASFDQFRSYAHRGEVFAASVMAL